MIEWEKKKQQIPEWLRKYLRTILAFEFCTGVTLVVWVTSRFIENRYLPRTKYFFFFLEKSQNRFHYRNMKYKLVERMHIGIKNFTPMCSQFWRNLPCGRSSSLSARRRRQTIKSLAAELLLYFKMLLFSFASHLLVFVPEDVAHYRNNRSLSSRTNIVPTNSERSFRCVKGINEEERVHSSSVGSLHCDVQCFLEDPIDFWIFTYFQ